MSINRLVAGGVMMAALWATGDQLLAERWSGPVLAWLFCALLMFIWSGEKRQFVKLRRCTGLVLDVSGATTMLIAGGNETAFLYAVYLWVIIGYGFRFGVRYLVSASILSIMGFTLVITVDPFWGSHFNLSIGLLAGLAMLPAYSFALIRQLAQARRRAEKADHAKTLFLARVSHELRTPLHAIIGMTEALRSTPLASDQVGMIETINTAAEGQVALVGDLLEFAKTGAGRSKSVNEELDLVELIGKVIAIAAVDGQKKGLLISSHITARTPLRLRGDERRIREVLLNLCSNAVKFTDQGSVTISADGVLNESGSVAVRIEVMDTGIGIASKHLDKVFDLFAQADETIFDRFGGTGLGLSLCRQQVQLLGGKIGVESIMGSGSTFWLSLTLEAAAEIEAPLLPARVLVVAEEAAGAAALQERLAALPGLRASGLALDITYEQGHDVQGKAVDAMIYAASTSIDGLPDREIRERFSASVSVHGTISELQRAVRIAASQSIGVRAVVASEAMDTSIRAATGLEGRRVLVADDNKVNRLVTSKMLSRAGAVAVLAADGEEALAVLSKGEMDLGLLDVNMPGLNGIEVAQFYAFSAPNGQRTPLIALTADESTDTQARCLEAGMVACLVKPIRTASLIDALTSVLSSRVTPSAMHVSTNPIDVSPRLDHKILSELESLGGLEFVSHLMADFKHDCLTSFASLKVTLTVQDVQRFRFEIHSIGSAAGNMGALALQKVCSPLSRIAEETFRNDGTRIVADLWQEWEKTSFELDQRLAAGSGAVPSRDIGSGSQRLTG